MQEWQETQALKLFLLLYWKKNTDLISERRNHASVIVKGSEKHHTLKDSFGNAFTNIKKITLEFFLGGGGRLQTHFNYVRPQGRHSILRLHVAQGAQRPQVEY